jgi:SAM-dependent methyltransferase
VSELILKRASPEEVLLIEPDGHNVAALHRRFDGDHRVRIQHGYLEDMDGSFSADTVVAVNVLEHVERPAGFLNAAFSALSPGGALLLLVPAIPALYSSLDKAFDHYRRYTRSELKGALLAAGFRIDKLHYLNVVGVAAWFVSGHILRRKTIGRRQVRFYDRLVIPWLRRLESLISPPLGQSLLVIARKS